MYDLVLIEVEQHPGKNVLLLDDMHGNSIVQPISHFQGNRRIWDLVYSGILYSFASGAEIGKGEIEALGLDQSPCWDAAVRHPSRSSDDEAPSE